MSAGSNKLLSQTSTLNSNNEPSMRTQSTVRTRLPELTLLTSFLFLPVFLFILLQPSVAKAETVYVKPSAEIVVRTGQGTSYKIIGMVKDGDSVELLEEENSYAKVRLKNGTEGWMVRRFLGRELPMRDMVESLRKENEEIKEKERYTSQNLVEVSTTLEQTKAKLKQLTLERDVLATDYKTLQADTADVISIKTEQQKTAELNQQLQQQLSLVSEENNELKKDRTLHWFLTGAGVLFLGILIGKMPGPSRRRKSSLL